MFTTTIFLLLIGRITASSNDTLLCVHSLIHRDGGSIFNEYFVCEPLHCLSFRPECTAGVARCTDNDRSHHQQHTNSTLASEQRRKFCSRFFFCVYSHCRPVVSSGYEATISFGGF
uniref:Putative secreted protein n=1 Tax=Anopheles darlingi TaxID=43151 RepID=A0A2M4DE84_ANODA